MWGRTTITSSYHLSLLHGLLTSSSDPRKRLAYVGFNPPCLPNHAHTITDGELKPFCLQISDKNKASLLFPCQDQGKCGASKAWNNCWLDAAKNTYRIHLLTRVVISFARCLSVSNLASFFAKREALSIRYSAFCFVILQGVGWSEFSCLWLGGSDASNISSNMVEQVFPKLKHGIIQQTEYNTYVLVLTSNQKYPKINLSRSANAKELPRVFSEHCPVFGKRLF